jgi:hypothetical protein
MLDEKCGHCDAPEIAATMASRMRRKTVSGEDAECEAQRAYPDEPQSLATETRDYRLNRGFAVPVGRHMANFSRRLGFSVVHFEALRLFLMYTC